MQIPRRARLGDLERAIMDRLWAIDPVIPESAMTVREIHESIAQERDIVGEAARGGIGGEGAKLVEEACFGGHPIPARPWRCRRGGR